MCGISGLVSANVSKFEQNLHRSLESVLHRGPDASGVYSSPNNRVLFGHRRLAIVDLSAGANQPMLSECGLYSIVFNGEIYNYQELKAELVNEGVVFKTRSDTEVLLKSYIHWGTGFIEKLNGPFAFAIYDRSNDIVLLARDRFGEKPLFYSELDGKFSFASELKAITFLIDQKLCFSESQVLSYLSRGYASQGQTVIDGVYSLAPGHLMTINAQTLRVANLEPFWKISRERIIQNSSEFELIEELDNILSDSVRLQLHCDVPACILLSGGVDSSLITAYASRHVSNVSTYTVKFTGHSFFDESKSARLISEHFGTRHTEIEGAEISPNLLESIVQKIDTPINDSSLLPTFLVYQAVSSRCKVALGGDGGDELFGGYKHYSRLALLERFLGTTLALCPSSVSSILKARIPYYKRYRNWADTIGKDLKLCVPNIREIFDPEYIQKNLLPFSKINKQSLELFEMDWVSKASGQGSAVRNAIFADINLYLSQSILVKSDRASMMNSVESRAPFLDIRLIDFALNKIPDHLKATSNARKILLKNLAKRLLPDSFDFHRKLGFNLPLGQLLRQTNWKSYVTAVFNSEYSVVNREACLSLFNDHQNGIDNSDKLFGLILLIRWSQQVGIDTVKA